MAVDWKTGALKWFFQMTHHDWIDLDVPHPSMVLRVPIDGKMTPVLAKGSKGGFFYVLNAKNGGPVQHFKITETQTYDPSGKGIAANNAGEDAAVPERRLVLHGGHRLLAGGLGEVQVPRQPADRQVQHRWPPSQPHQARQSGRTAWRSSGRRRAPRTTSGSTSSTAASAAAAPSATRRRRTARRRTRTTPACRTSRTLTRTPARTRRTCRTSAPG